MDEFSRGQGGEWDLREALFDLQRYLADQLAPLMMVDTFDLLMRQPPSLSAEQIVTWAADQYGMAGGATRLSDYYFHALKKIHLMSEYKLVEETALAPFFGGVASALLTACPGEEREALGQSMALLGRSESPRPTAVTVLHRPGGADVVGGPPAAAPGAAPGAVRAAAGGRASGAPSVPDAGDLALALDGLRRFSVLLEKLGSGARGAAAAARPGPGAPAMSAEVAPQLLTLAVREARTGTELERHLERLRVAGIDSRPAQVLQTLSGALPGWSIPVGAPGAATGPALPTVEALRRYVSLSRDSSEGTRRFFEMVETAVKHFNEGSLGRAATMFDLAEQIIAERKLDDSSVANTRTTMRDRLDADRLKEYAEDPARHSDLARVLAFFPALTPRGLLSELEVEERRDRRRLLLSLLIVHGAAARALAIERLRDPVDSRGGPAAWYFQRNLLNVLRRIPRSPEEPVEGEVEILDALTRPVHHVWLVKEALTNLGQIRHEKAAEVLIARLKDLERLAVSSPGVPYAAEDLVALLDRVVAALARSGSSAGLAAAAEHGLSGQAAWGDTQARLTDLSAVDLSAETAARASLVAALRAELPRKVFGITLPKRAESLEILVSALAATPSADVRQVFEEICEQFPDQDFAKAAARSLSAFREAPAAETAPPPAAPSLPGLSGDLALFGLPGLLQSLAQSEVDGVLTISDREGAQVASIEFDGGRLAACRAGLLRGRDAVYQLFENPVSGTFEFVARRAGTPAPGGERLELLPLIFEGSRRFDELGQARALVPANGILEATGVRPTPLEEETDPTLAHGVWTRLRAGMKPEAIEVEVQVDSYRVFRLIAHWIEEGALQAKPAG
jgi:hypothetical protein